MSPEIAKLFYHDIGTVLMKYGLSYMLVDQHYNLSIYRGSSLREPELSCRAIYSDGSIEEKWS